MIVNPQISLHRLVLSLSEALDLVSPSVADHQLRVAYMSTRIAQAMGVRGQSLRDIFHAAALHDIGMIRSENRVRAVAHNQLEGLGWHAEFGYELLRNNEFLAAAAPIVRCHHAAWDRGAEDGSDGQPPPLGSYIVALADAVDRYMRRDVPILRQARDLAESIRMARTKQQPGPRLGSQDLRKGRQNQSLFARVRRARDDPAPRRAHAELRQHLAPLACAERALLQVELAITRDADARRLDPQRRESFGVQRRLDAHAAERPQGRSQQRREAPVARKGAIRKPAVDHEAAGAARGGEAEEVRPEFGFQQHEHARLEDRLEAARVA